jgi:ArsR family metal-binding transcriptional regulator
MNLQILQKIRLFNLDFGGVALPKKEANEIYELLPKYDCGLCENPRCMTFARRILHDIQKPKECQFLTDDNIKKINEITSEPDAIRKHPHPNQDEEIIEINPCTEDGFVTLETQLKSRVMKQDLYGDFFDQFQMCLSLSEIDAFDSMNCSSKMGYALAEIKGKRTHIFKTGKIIMRRADDKEDALNTLAIISKMLTPARLCSCNNTLVDCFGGACKICAEGECAALIDATDIEEGYKGEGYTLEQILINIDMSNNPHLEENFKLLDDIVFEIHKIHEDILSQNEIDVDSNAKTIGELLKKIKRNCTEHLLSTTEIKSSLVALTQYGITCDLMRANEAILNLKDHKDDPLYEKAVDILFDAYSAFSKKDIEKTNDIQNNYSELLRAWKEDNGPIDIVKIAANGFYISRVLGKPVPQNEVK